MKAAPTLSRSSLFIDNLFLIYEETAFFLSLLAVGIDSC